MNVATFLQEISEEGVPLAHRAAKVIGSMGSGNFKELIREIRQLQTGARQPVVINIENMQDFTYVAVRNNQASPLEIEDLFLKTIKAASIQP